MDRVVVVGPRPGCGALTAARFAQLLGLRLSMDAFAFEPGADLVPARSRGAHPAVSAHGGEIPLDLDALRVDTVVWLHFGPRAYLRDWIAGWLDSLVNGAQGWRRRRSRASLGDFFRSCAALLHPPVLSGRQVEALRSNLRLVELNSPEQAHFWLHIQEERVRETLAPVG